MKLRVSLAGVLGNAADAMEEMLELASEGINCTCDEDESDEIDCPSCCNPDLDQARDSIFMLREIIKHARGVANGEHSLKEFAEFYCLEPKE